MWIRVRARWIGIGCAAACCLLAAGCVSTPGRGEVVATFSIAAFDPRTGDLGVAVQSKFLAVGTVVPWARAGVGAVATQAWANPAFGPEGLALLADGSSAEETVRALVDADEGRERRQVGVVDAGGQAASYTGKGCFPWAGGVEGDGFCCQGNILAGEAVVKDMAAAFTRAREAGEGELADWLVAALRAGQAAGGDRRGRQSAALLVVREGAGYGGTDRYVDLRVDDHATPIEELARLLELHKEVYAAAHHNPPQREEPAPPEEEPPPPEKDPPADR